VCFQNILSNIPIELGTSFTSSVSEREVGIKLLYVPERSVNSESELEAGIVDQSETQWIGKTARQEDEK
jgi:hypothetical protein